MHTLFISHTAADAAFVTRLSDMLRSRLASPEDGGPVEVFCASDGSSLKLGTDWNAGLVEALQRAKLVVLVLTPGANDSTWVQFEAGFAYALGARVVPAGFFGFDVADARSPLNSLHGFNVTGPGSLDNIIAVANDVFSVQCQRRFSEQEYDELLRLSRFSWSGRGGVDLIESISAWAAPFDRAVRLASSEELIGVTRAVLDREGLASTIDERSRSSETAIDTKGMRVWISSSDSAPKATFCFDPITFGALFDTAARIMSAMCGGAPTAYEMSVEFEEFTTCDTEPWKQLGHLFDSSAQIAGASDPEARFVISTYSFNSWIECEGIRLAVRVAEGRAMVLLRFGSELKPARVMRLIGLLVARGVVRRRSKQEVEQISSRRRQADERNWQEYLDFRRRTPGT